MKKVTFEFIVNDEIVNELENKYEKDLVDGKHSKVISVLDEHCKYSRYNSEEYEG